MRALIDTPVTTVRSGAPAESRVDLVAVEEPLEIRLGYSDDDVRELRTIAITMRTPGHDAELAAGFLFGEGIVRQASDIERIFSWGPPSGDLRLQNVIRVELRPGVEIDLKRLQRNFYTSSSCGVCGKTSIEAVEMARTSPLPPAEPWIAAETVHRLPERLREAQAVFDRTGGLHAAGLFDAAGTILAVREDVGRHNAVDKLIGSQLLASRAPSAESTSDVRSTQGSAAAWGLGGRGIMVSGRASFELVQKAVMAGIGLLAAVGAPSSLAVQLAEQSGLTLLGFVRNERFNIYTGAGRVMGVGGTRSVPAT